jgi:hypothetical protein
MLTSIVLVLAACRAAEEQPAPLPSFAETCFQCRPAKSDLPLVDAQRLLEPTSAESRLSADDKQRVRFKGLFRLREWTPEIAVRVAVKEPAQHLRVHVWCQSQGVSIFLFPAGAAYRIMHEPGGPGWTRDLRLAMSTLVTTDDRRGVRLPESPYQIRCQDGAVVITKGDVRVMTVPLVEKAARLYLEGPGDALLTDLALFRSGPVPDEVWPLHRTILDGGRPAELAWKETLPEAARFERRADGCVELSATNSKAIALATVNIAGPGLHEVIFQIDEASPRTGIAVLNAKGEPLDGIEFGHEGKNPLAFNYGNPRDQPWLGNFEFPNRAVWLAGPRQWFRLIANGAWTKCSISGDGVHWGSVLDFRDRNGAWQAIALYVREPGDRKEPEFASRHIRLRTLEVRELTGLTSAVPADLSAKAAAAGVEVKSDKGESVQAWMERIAGLRPAGASLLAWRYACTLKALAAPLASDVAESLLLRAVRERLSELRDPRIKIELLQDAALLWRSRRDSAERLLELWDQLGREVLNAGSGADFDRYQHAAAHASIPDPPERYGSISWELARDALLLYYVEHRTEELDRLKPGIAFWRISDPNLGGWMAGQQLDPLLQALDVSPLHKTQRRRDAVAIPRSVTPPLNRAASNILSELLSALEARQYADAAGILASCQPPTRDAPSARGYPPNGRAPSAANEGLVPAPGDDQLYVSFPAVLRLLMLEYPGLSEAMLRRFGPADQLKIDQALAQGDLASIEALPLQYYGTPAAAGPCQWLGDRALAAAELAQAASWYEEGLLSASPEQQPDLAARKRLVSAMLGSKEGRPPTQAVAFHGVKVAPDVFESWIRSALARQAPAAESSPSADELPLINLPHPVFFQASTFGRLEDAAGRGFHGEELPSWEFRDIDWSWRHLTVRAGEDLLFAVERSWIAAFDLAGGRIQWDVALHNRWSLGPVRPLICGQRLYLRAATLSDRTGIECLDAKTGRRKWLANCGGVVAADPLWYRGRLFVLTVGSAGEQAATTLCLAELQPETGEVLSRRPIVETAEPDRPLSECQASWAGNRLVILLSGSVICTDLQGKVIWLRQETALPYELDPAYLRQHCLPAIASADRLFVEQPGSCAIDCLSLATGQRHWRRGIVGLQSIVDLPDDRLLARTARGVVVLSKTSGEVLWQREFPGILSAIARTSGGQLLCARQAMVRDKPNIVFLWLDSATGQTLAHSTTALEHNKPIFFGPFVGHGDRIWCCFGYGAATDSPVAENEKRIVALRPAAPAVADEGP